MSTAFQLLLPRRFHEAMLEHAECESPNECCGLLAGRIENETGIVTHHYPLINALKSPVEFESEPKSMFLAQKDIRQKNLTELAIYHSHPTSAPIPSRKDLARNYSADVMNLIISLESEPPLMRAWLLDEDYREGTVTIEV